MPTPYRKLARVALAASLAVVSGPVLPAMEPEPMEVLTTSNPDFAEGRRAVEAKNWNAAIKAFTAAAQRDARNADIQNMLAYSYRNAGQLETAFKHYQRALLINPKRFGTGTDSRLSRRSRSATDRIKSA